LKPDILPDEFFEEIEEDNIIKLVVKLSNNFTTIIPKEEIQKHGCIWWGNNGLGDRFAKKKFNYTVIYKNKTIQKYSENDNDSITDEILTSFFSNLNSKIKGIVGLYIHSFRENVETRPIRKDIDKAIKMKSCVVCGSKSGLVCDHKNDLYNDIRVLNIKTQILDDFQPLCNHCNLQKREISNKEKQNKKIYSSKNLEPFNQYDFEFPWEKKAFDDKDKDCKKDTYWYDPIEFHKKIYQYIQYRIHIVREIKRRKVIF
jgi:hypothetical protein